jgi:hypothetical protein
MRLERPPSGEIQSNAPPRPEDVAALNPFIVIELTNRKIKGTKSPFSIRFEGRFSFYGVEPCALSANPFLLAARVNRNAFARTQNAPFLQNGAL